MYFKDRAAGNPLRLESLSSAKLGAGRAMSVSEEP